MLWRIITFHFSQNTDNIFELPCSKNVVCSFVHGESSFVGSDQHGLKCLTCKYDTHNCVHVGFVQTKFDEDDESFPFLPQVFSDRPVRRSPSIPLCLSKQKIQFKAEVRNPRLTGDLKSNLHTDENGIFQIMLGGHNNLSSPCSSCSSPWSNESAKNVKLYLFKETIICNGEHEYCCYTNPILLSPTIIDVISSNAIIFICNQGLHNKSLRFFNFSSHLTTFTCF
jgi:hypothetical protein